MIKYLYIRKNAYCFFGTPEFAVTTLEKLIITDNHEIIAVVTQPDKKEVEEVK